ncbi:MAG TPA: lipoprotein [Rhodanobacteraceae bacterium]|nr:lipoprotein [Rhodanobacteraceae bacterium]
MISVSLLLLASASIAGCGQKGPLVLPARPSASAPAASTPATATSAAKPAEAATSILPASAASGG